MSRLNGLITELCPDGVNYIILSDMAEIGTGSSDRKDACEDGEYPFYVRSRDILKINKYEFDETAIIIPGEGGIGEIFHYVDGKYALHQRAYRIHVTDPRLDTKYLYYYMFSKFKDFIMQKAVSSTVTSIRKPMIQNFPVAVPPIEVQHEVIKILDEYSEVNDKLIENLTLERNKREKQYLEYTSQIFDKNTGEDANEYSLGELFDFRNGLSKGKEFFGRGIPFIRYTDVYNNRFLRKENITALVDCTKQEIEKLNVSRGDVLFTRTSETAEDVGWSSVMLDDMEACVFNGFTIKATPKTNLILPEYCVFCFSTNDFRQYVTSHCAFTTRASLTGKTIAEYKIRIPDRDTQRKMFELLNELTLKKNELSAALLSEIEFRKKQYACYREKILTFKELGA